MSFSNPSALVIEDNEQLGALYDKVLSQIGLRTILASSISEALAHLATTVPDMVLLDMNMSDGVGTTIIDHIKANPRFAETEIVVVTGGTQYQAAAEERGVDHFFQKPVSVRMLMTFTRRLLGGRLPTAQLIDEASYV
jgi:CheY-like chemotaxis protein